MECCRCPSCYYSPTARSPQHHQHMGNRLVCRHQQQQDRGHPPVSPSQIQTSASSWQSTTAKSPRKRNPGMTFAVDWALKTNALSIPQKETPTYLGVKLGKYETAQRQELRPLATDMCLSCSCITPICGKARHSQFQFGKGKATAVWRVWLRLQTQDREVAGLNPGSCSGDLITQPSSPSIVSGWCTQCLVFRIQQQTCEVLWAAGKNLTLMILQQRKDVASF